MSKTLMARLDYTRVAEHYAERVAVHRQLRQAFKAKKAAPYTDLALGITSPLGNYSAAEHGLGPKILSRSKPERVRDLAGQILAEDDPMSVPRLVYGADIWCLKISVGSELGAMLEPKRFWVTNIRTVWAHLLVKYNDDVRNANEMLKSYRDDEYDSEASYAAWCDVHMKLDVALTRLAEAGTTHAQKQGIKGGELAYLWADAVANGLYELREELLG